jgi:predicted nucleotidyltransferase
VDLQRPLQVITPTLDGDVLALLARGRIKLTGRDISRKIQASHEGVRLTLRRLVDQGIVLAETAGRARLYRLNRRHVAAPLIEQLASLRLEVIERLRRTIKQWPHPPTLAALFGSVARGEAGPRSDIDILVVRPRDTDADAAAWRDQITDLQSRATAMTGNDTHIIERSAAEIVRLGGSEPVLAAIGREGIELFGSLSLLRRRVKLRK